MCYECVRDLPEMDQARLVLEGRLDDSNWMFIEYMSKRPDGMDRYGDVGAMIDVCVCVLMNCQ